MSWQPVGKGEAIQSGVDYRAFFLMPFGYNQTAGRSVISAATGFLRLFVGVRSYNVVYMSQQHMIERGLGDHGPNRSGLLVMFTGK